MTDIVYLSDVRLSFPNLAEPQQRDQPDGTKKISYNCELIMEPNHPGFAQFMQLYATMAADKWKAHAQTVMQMIANDRKTRCFGQGSEKIRQATMTVYDGYQNMVFISCGNKNRPQIMDASGKPVNGDDTMQYQALARKLYGGCRVNAAVKPWMQENKHGRGIRCDLIAIQFLRDDAPFGDSAPDATNLFGAVQAPAGAPANPFGMPAQPGAMPGFFGQPAAAPAMPAPPVFGMPQMPSFFGR